jgi:uncharacterized membrane protein YqjE
LEVAVVANGLIDSIGSYSNRLIRVATLLVDMHMDIAMQEAEWEKKRLTSGLVMLSIGGGLMGMSGLLLHAIALVVLQSLVHSWLVALAIATAVDFVIGSIFILAATRKLRGPYMAQTQARLSRTASTLMQDYPSNSSTG